MIKVGRSGGASMLLEWLVQSELQISSPNISLEIQLLFMVLDTLKPFLQSGTFLLSPNYYHSYINY